MKEEYEIQIFNEFNKKYPNMDFIIEKINSGININVKNNRGETILMSIINHINEIIWLDENGNLAETGDESIQIVQRMVPKIDISLIKYLLNMGANPNIEDDDGIRCIQEAVMTFRSDIFRMLLDYGADINFKTHWNNDFIDWINDELREFEYDGNNIAVIEISKMVEMLKEKNKKE
jgi:ankyrin repeat protein